MVIYETINRLERERFKDRDGKGGSGRTPLAAGVARLVASAIRVPCEVVKQRLQVGEYDAIGQAVRGVLKGGRGVVFGGFGALVVRDVPQAVINFSVYEKLKKIVIGRRGGAGGVEGKLRKEESLVIGALAGMMGAFLSNPMDVVKTRMMTQKSMGGVEKRYANVVQCFWKIGKDEGMRAFMRGVGPQVVQKGMQYALYFAIYETLKNNLATLLKVDLSDGLPKAGK